MISPPIWESYGEVSKRRMVRTPESPSISACQNASFPTPFGATTPNPVTTTRCFTLGMRETPANSPEGMPLRHNGSHFVLVKTVFFAQLKTKRLFFKVLSNQNDR